MKTLDCVAIGEVLIDRVTTVDGEHALVGGSPSNLIINLTRLGHAVRLISATGNDEDGEIIRAYLNHYNVNTETIDTVDAPTSRVYIHQSTATPVPRFDRGADYRIAYRDAFASWVRTSRILHFTYWPLSANPAKDTVLKLIDVAKAHDTQISFDPNFHPDLWTPSGLTPGQVNDILPNVDIIKPSLDDCKRLFQMDGTKEMFMDRFEAYHIPLIVMTLGGDGVYVSHHNNRRHIPALTTDIVDTTGAGDAFMAGFLSKHLTHASLDESIAFAQTMSAHALKTIGAIAPIEDLKGV